MRIEIQKSKLLTDGRLVLSSLSLDASGLWWDSETTIPIPIDLRDVGTPHPTDSACLTLLRLKSQAVCQYCPFYGPMGAAGQITDAESVKNLGDVSPLDDPVPDALEQADTRRPRQHDPPAQCGSLRDGQVGMSCRSPRPASRAVFDLASNCMIAPFT